MDRAAIKASLFIVFMRSPSPSTKLSIHLETLK
jgi:hypothetical protein